MFFSEKSSFAQSGVFVSAAVEKVTSKKQNFNTVEELLKAKIGLIVICAIDKTSKALLPLIEKTKSAVGRLLTPRIPVDRSMLENPEIVGEFQTTNSALHVSIGDAKLHYPDPRIDGS